MNTLRIQDGGQDIVKQIKDLLHDNWKQIHSFVKQKETTKTKLSKRIEDPEWFQGNCKKIESIHHKSLNIIHYVLVF